MSQALDDPWSDATFERDAALEAQRHATRRRYREIVQIPRLRAIGSLCLLVTVCIHNAVFLGRVHWSTVSAYGALQCAYVAATWYSLRRHYRADARLDLGTLYLATDIALFTLAIYVSGGEKSWLLPILCVRVADQVGTSQRRALAFTHETLLLHAALVAYLAFVEQRALSLRAELAKVLFVYVLNLYLVLAAGPSERQRKRATQMAQQTRELIEALASKTELLERERVRVEAATQAKSRFLANMSHEIRTPMNGVLGTSELLLEGELAASQRQMVETIESCGRSLLAIVNDVLDMSKIEVGKLGLEQVAFVVASLIDDTIRSLRMHASAKGIDLRVDLCEETSLRLLGDPLRLRQVLTNLVGNALKFTQHGSVTLAVMRVERTPSAIALRFEVQDTGIGMSPEAVERVFEAFAQADDSTTRRFGGTGLGLSIAKQLVEMMGSKIEVTSEIGKGSQFSFSLSLPLAPTDSTLAAPAGVADELSQMRALAPRVLVAEDTAVNRVLVQKMLELLGCRVASVENGAEAVELLCGAHDFAIVLMDWHMPMLDGLEATRRVRAWEKSNTADRHTPIIAFTASAFAEEAARCTEAGMDGVLNKPLTKAQLLSVLQRHLLGVGTPTAAPEPTLEPVETPLRPSHIDELLRLDAATPGGFLAGIVASFLDSAPGRLEELADAIRAGDSARVEQLAHRFKGSAANLGAWRLMKPLDEIERSARDGHLTDADTKLQWARVEQGEAEVPLRAILHSLQAPS
jgi:signal transduction histidine kinase/DNA-binding NarL/FixJ family response regulator